GRHAQEPHPPEGQQQDDREGGERDQRASHRQQEDQDDQDDHHDLLGEGAEQRVAHAGGEIGPVVGGGDVDDGGGAGVEPLAVGGAMGELAALAGDGALDLLDQG